MKLVLFDADGTLCTTRSGDTFRRGADDWVLLPNRERVRGLPRTGIASNQGGVACGFLAEADISRALYQLADLLNIRHVAYCPHHPDAACGCRKPKPGMLLKLMAMWGAGPAETLFVGDRPEDAGAAAAAGCEFLHAEEYFK